MLDCHLYREGLVMLSTRSTPRIFAAAAAAGTCLLLGACGGSAASGSGSSATSGASSVAPSKGLLTGHFCTDFSSLGKIVSHVSPAQAAQLDHSRPAAEAYLRQIAADFDGLSEEAPAKIQKLMHTIAGQYSSTADAATGGESLTQLKNMAGSLGSTGASVWRRACAPPRAAGRRPPAS
jgi:hypothetical protein